MSDEAIEKLTNENFDSKVASGISVVDFFAEWCAPCRMLTPVLDELSKEYAGKVKFYKVDIDQSQDLTQKNQVTSVPTIVFFKDGKEVDRSVGLKDADGLKEMIAGVS